MFFLVAYDVAYDIADLCAKNWRYVPTINIFVKFVLLAPYSEKYNFSYAAGEHSLVG